MDLEQKVLQIIEKMEKVAPKVVDYAIWDTQINGIGSIAIGIVGAAVGWKSVRCVQRMLDGLNSDEYEVEEGAEIKAVVASLGAIAGLFLALGMLLDIWNWVAVFRPDLALAHRLMEKVL